MCPTYWQLGEFIPQNRLAWFSTAAYECRIFAHYNLMTKCTASRLSVLSLTCLALVHHPQHEVQDAVREFQGYHKTTSNGVVWSHGAIPITCCHTPSYRNLPQAEFYSCAQALTEHRDRLRNQFTALPRWLPTKRAAGLVCTSLRSTVCLCTRSTRRSNHKGIAMKMCRQVNAGQSLQSWQTCQQHSLTLRKQCTDAYAVQMGNKKCTD